jgi:hypothetical protein
MRVLAALTWQQQRRLPAADAPLPQFVDATRGGGIAFQHVNGASPDKHLVETMGSGRLFLRLRRRRLDRRVPGGRRIAGGSARRSGRGTAVHNRGNGTFEDGRSIGHPPLGVRHGACAPTTTAMATDLYHQRQI